MKHNTKLDETQNKIQYYINNQTSKQQSNQQRMKHSSQFEPSLSQQKEGGSEDNFLNLPEQLFLQLFKKMSLIMMMIVIANLPVYAVLLKIFINTQHSSSLYSQFMFIFTIYYSTISDDVLLDLYLCQITLAKFKEIYIYYDISIQLYLIFLLFYLEVSLSNLKQIKKKQYIQSYSLQIFNLPNIPEPQLMYSLEEFIQKNVFDKYEIILEADAISSQKSLFDIQFCPSKINIEKIIQKRIQEKNQYLENSSSDQIIPVNLKANQVQNQQILYAFVTFNTRKQRYLALRAFRNNHKYFSCSSKKFLNSKIIVEKAANPEEIILQNIYSKALTQYFFRSLCFGLSISCILGSNIGLLFLNKSNNASILKVIVPLIVQVILKIIIVNLAKFEQHYLRSREQLSICWKLTLFSYINFGLLSLFSLINLQSITSYSNLVSNNSFTSFNAYWFEQVGINLLIFILTQSIWKNIEPYFQFGQNYLIGLISFWCKHGNKYMSFKLLYKDFKQKYEKSESTLASYYADLISIVMIIITYSYAMPVVYLLLALICFVASLSYRNFIKFYSKSSAFSSDKIHVAAMKSIYLSVIIHILIQFYTIQPSKEFILVILILFTSLYIFRFLIFRYIYKAFLRIAGPCLASTISTQIKIDLPIQERFSLKQILSKINELERRREIINNAIMSQNHDAQGYRKYMEILRKKAQKLSNCNQAGSQDKLYGKISYFNDF